MSTQEIKERIDILSEKLNAANIAYYINNDPIFPDYEYDMMMKELEKLESENPEFVWHNSPTKTVGSDLSIQSDFAEVRRSFPMGSIANCYTEEDLAKWISKYPNCQYIVEWKKDGTSCSLRYRNGVLVEASTRGNGYVGDNITTNVMTINNIPKKLDCPYLPIDFEVRGEVLITKESFERINAERIANGEQPYANCRNLAAGSIKQLDAKVTASRDLIFIPYSAHPWPDFNEGDIVNEWCNSKFSTQRQTFETLKSLGFQVDDYYIANSFDDVLDIINNIKDNNIKANKPWDNDGLVIKLNSRTEQNLAGYTDKNPKFAIAYKWTVEMASTKLIDVKWQVGRTGKLTPVGILEPVEVEGTTISNVNLNNMDFIREKQVAIGGYYFIYRGGSVIPVLHGPDVDRNNENNVKII